MMVSFTKIALCSLFVVMTSSASAFGLPTPKTLVKRSNNNQLLSSQRQSSVKLSMADVTSDSDIPRGGDVGGGTATIPTEVFNLVKSIAGAGVLSLPAG
jgi:amino acid permease